MKKVHRQKSVPRNTNCIPRLYKLGKRAHQRKALRQQICKVDAMGIDGKNMSLPGEVFWLRVNQEEVSRGHSSLQQRAD